MSDKYYRIWVEIEEVDGRTSQATQLGERLELATFEEHSQAKDFCYEISQHHSAQAAGEGVLQNEMEDSNLYSAGD